MDEILANKISKVPIYDFSLNAKVGESLVSPAPIVILEGIHAFYDERLVERMGLKIFIQSDCDIRLSRRIKRDI